MLILEEYLKKVSVSVVDFQGRSRKPEIVAARQVWWFYLQNHGHGQSEIGRMFGRDHATVWHSIKRVRELISINDIYLSKYLDATGYTN